MRVFLTLWLSCICAVSACASENAIIVINEQSASSKLIGNYYIHARDFPPENVIYLSDIPDQEIIKVEEFRQLILGPIMATIEKRKLANQISYVIYSSDFPTIIDVSADRKKMLADPEMRKNANIKTGSMFNPMVSINAATYFYQLVLSSDVAYLSLTANTYSRANSKTLLNDPFDGADDRDFNTAIAQSKNGEYPNAIDTLERLAKKHPLQLAVLYWLSRCYAWQENAAEASKWLRRCIAVGWSSREYTQNDAAFDKIRTDEKFNQTVALIPKLPFRGGPSLGFRSSYFWGPNGMINSTADQGNRFMLSTVLAVNRNKGNSERESLNYLSRSIKSDGSSPKGSFYFTSTKDVRTTARNAGYLEAIDELDALGFQCEIVTTDVPKLRKDVAGLSMGTAKFKLEHANLNFLPGAICENMTSYGGRLLPNSQQTKLTSFLRYGAAGSSGTVVEPFAIQQKFPHARMHVHYVRGCTLAEAFYQSIDGPFQLLIVGDALCKPWAKIPRIKLTGNVLSTDPISGDLTISISGNNSPAPIRLIEMYLDGRLIRRIEASQLGKITIDTNSMPDGFHEFRFVPIAASAISTRGSISAGVVVNNRGKQVQLKSNTLVTSINQSIELDAFCEGANRVLLLHNKRVIKESNGDSVFAKVPAFYFGRGTVKVEAAAFVDDELIRSRPMEIEITGPISSNIPQIKTAK